jgi:hypothetical protein
MSTADPQPPSPSQDPRIESLLLAGLDRYFAGEFEHAIQVWSRVFFLDRGHARARAYIDRARGAIAERQREAEARTARPDGAGVVQGDAGARVELAEPLPGVSTLRTRPAAATAVARASVSADAGHARTSGALARAATSATPGVTAPEPVGHDAAPRGGRLRARLVAQFALVALAAVLLFGAGYVVAARDRLAVWWGAPAQPPRSVPAMIREVAADAPSTEELLDRARRHLAAGRADAALAVLKAIAASDPQRSTADALEARAMRALQAETPPGGSRTGAGTRHERSAIR